MTIESATTILIGDLLVRAEMTTPRDMADAVPISLKTGLPIGRVLIGAGGLTEAHLQQALLAQSLIRDSLLSVDLAVQALRIAVREGFNLEQALRIVGWQPDEFVSENRLGQLLVAAGVVPAEELEQALRVFYTAGLPLARVLVLRGSISNIVAYAALSSQQLLRENKLTREQALQCVRAAAESRATIEDNYVDGYLRMQPSHNFRLGELLVLANMATEMSVMQAVDQAVKRGETLGEVLVAQGTIRPDELERALEAQRLVTKGVLDSGKAADVLRKANYERTTVSQALNYHAPGQLVRSQFDLNDSSCMTDPSATDPMLVTQDWLDDLRANSPIVLRDKQQRSEQDTRARQLGRRLLDKIEASRTRNVYLKNILVDKDDKDSSETERNELAALKQDLEDAADFETCMDLLEKMITRVENYAYHNGYLRSRLDAISAQLEMEDRLRQAEQAAEAWRERANSAIAHDNADLPDTKTDPADAVDLSEGTAADEGRQTAPDAGDFAKQAALVARLTNVAGVVSEPCEPYETLHDLSAMVSHTVPVQPMKLKKKPIDPNKTAVMAKPQKKTPRGGKKRR